MSDSKHIDNLERDWAAGKLVPETAPVDAAGPAPDDPHPEDFYMPPKKRHVFSHWAMLGVAAVAAFFLWGERDPLRYYLSNEQPIDVGHFGNTHPEGSEAGHWVKLSGIASPVRGTYTRFFTEYELLHLIGTPILVQRAEGKDVAEYRGYAFNWKGEGRLFRLADVPELEGVRKAFAEKGELSETSEVFLVKEGDVPRRGWGPLGPIAVYLALFGVNLFFGLRRLRAERAARAVSPGAAT